MHACFRTNWARFRKRLTNQTFSLYVASLTDASKYNSRGHSFPTIPLRGWPYIKAQQKCLAFLGFAAGQLVNLFHCPVYLHLSTEVQCGPSSTLIANLSMASTAQPKGLVTQEAPKSVNPVEVVSKLLQNTANPSVVRELVSPNATYVSLAYTNANL